MRLRSSNSEAKSTGGERQSVCVSPSTGVWYTWKWSCWEGAVTLAAAVSFPEHLRSSDCCVRLKRDDVHVQKQRGSLNTARGSSCEGRGKMISAGFNHLSLSNFIPHKTPSVLPRLYMFTCCCENESSELSTEQKVLHVVQRQNLTD